MQLRVLSWSLSNTDPDAPAQPDLTSVLTAVAPDVALLQRTPARWPALTAERLRAEYRQVGTIGSPLRCLLARLGMGSRDAYCHSAIIARSDRIIAERVQRVRRRPPVMTHGAQLACGLWLINLVFSDPDPADVSAAASLTLRWADGAPAVLCAGAFGQPESEQLAPVAVSDDEAVFIAGAIELAQPPPPGGAPGPVVFDVRLT